MTQKNEWISALDAARLLGVSRTTIYAYVSRGFVRSQAGPGPKRERRYSREDIERLRRRRDERRNPETAVGRALHWGLPILESAITLIANGKLFYRGYDATELARTRSIEEVASLIWTGAFESDIADTQLHVVSGTHGSQELPFTARAQSVLSVVGARDPLAWDLRPRAVAQCGWRILNLLTSVAAETAELSGTIDQTLAAAWVPKSAHAPELIRAALILIADHELNVSSFTARCIASGGSNPYAVAVGGLASVEGTKHGGASIRVETLLAELRRTRDLRRAVAEKLRRGETIEGFGHPLYPAGDPRAIALLSMLTERFPRAAEVAFAAEVAAAGASVTGERPTVDFALAALSRVLRLPHGAPLILFALGRTIGWIGQAIEQYALDAIIRPRAKYVGEPPR